jgi:excisionase family DNA binding protein
MTTESEPTLADVVAELRKLRRAMAPAEGSFSVEEAAEELGCSDSRVYRLLASGKLKRAKKAGRHSRVTVRSVRAYQLTGECADDEPAPPKRGKQKPVDADGAAAAIRALKVGR